MRKYKPRQMDRNAIVQEAREAQARFDEHHDNANGDFVGALLDRLIAARTAARAVGLTIDTAL